MAEHLQQQTADYVVEVIGTDPDNGSESTRLCECFVVSLIL